MNGPVKPEEIIEEFCQNAKAELASRWEAWPIDLSLNEMHEVVGGLLARQVTLAVELAVAPSTWNPHMAPVVLRSMADVHITLAWILQDPVERSRRFIHYGLGQTKLQIEHRKARWDNKEPSEAERLIVSAEEAWLDSQRWSFLTIVDVGSWSDLSTRRMAEEADLLDFYNYVYAPFSAAAHSMWHHVGRYNLSHCASPLHRHHRVPVVPDFPPDAFFVILGAKYMNKSFRAFDEKFSVSVSAANSFDVIRDRFDKMSADDAPEAGGEDDQ